MNSSPDKPEAVNPATALVEFSGRKIAETKEINENSHIDLDISGNLVAMTIEHARQQANLPSLSSTLTKPNFSIRARTAPRAQFPVK
ncbi:MAG TPA: DUF2283 domain-containing protein [Acidobacteriota bacterium]|nr:DUF2283 domain-containing protein [Acidobacteriota bacterium]